MKALYYSPWVKFITRPFIQDFELELHKVLSEEVALNAHRRQQFEIQSGVQMRPESAHTHS
jgi:hypothetical protein